MSCQVPVPHGDDRASMRMHVQYGTNQVNLASGLWIRIDLLRIRIRIDLLRIRIQHFCSIRIQIRIQAKTELLKTISFSNFFEIKI
jgi:hypothetical protein